MFSFFKRKKEEVKEHSVEDLKRMTKCAKNNNKKVKKEEAVRKNSFDKYRWDAFLQSYPIICEEAAQEGRESVEVFLLDREDFIDAPNVNMPEILVGVASKVYVYLKEKGLNPRMEYRKRYHGFDFSRTAYDQYLIMADWSEEQNKE